MDTALEVDRSPFRKSVRARFHILRVNVFFLPCFITSKLHFFELGTVKEHCFVLPIITFFWFWMPCHSVSVIDNFVSGKLIRTWEPVVIARLKHALLCAQTLGSLFSDGYLIKRHRAAHHFPFYWALKESKTQTEENPVLSKWERHEQFPVRVGSKSGMMLDVGFVFGVFVSRRGMFGEVFFAPQTKKPIRVSGGLMMLGFPVARNHFLLF